MGPSARRGTRTAAVVLGAALVAGCSPDPAPRERTTPTPGSVALRLESVSGVGQLDEATRTALETAVGEVLSRYIVEAWLGDFPRREFVGAFESFTSGAARAAAADIEQLTAARAQDAESVRATRLEADLSYLVVRRRAVSATAVVDLSFAAVFPDGESRRLSLAGRLMLEELDGEWYVFGYDVRSDDGISVSSSEEPS